MRCRAEGNGPLTQIQASVQLFGKLSCAFRSFRARNTLMHTVSMYRLHTAPFGTERMQCPGGTARVMTQCGRSGAFGGSRHSRPFVSCIALAVSRCVRANASQRKCSCRVAVRVRHISRSPLRLLPLTGSEPPLQYQSVAISMVVADTGSSKARRRLRAILASCGRAQAVDQRLSHCSTLSSGPLASGEAREATEVGRQLSARPEASGDAPVASCTQGLNCATLCACASQARPLQRAQEARYTCILGRQVICSAPVPQRVALASAPVAGRTGRP